MKSLGYLLLIHTKTILKNNNDIYLMIHNNSSNDVSLSMATGQQPYRHRN